MIVVDTSEYYPANYSPEQQLWIYCAFDSMVTMAINEETDKNIDEDAKRIYRFQQALQAPAMAMMLRGIKVDSMVRQQLIMEFDREYARIDKHLQWLAIAVWGEGLNPRSFDQKYRFFCKTMRYKPVKVPNKGEWKISFGREALEKLKENFHAEPFVNHILALSDLEMKLRVLRSGTDDDGRLRSSFNVGGTNTGRWSSSKNIYAQGTNMQNITDKMRRMLIADENRMLCYADLEQAESYIVAYLSGDPELQAALKSGDLHTYVSRMIWSDLPWTGDIKRDRVIADREFYRGFTYRDMSKRGGHAYNYYGKPPTVARHLKIPSKLSYDFQEKYFSKFSFIPRWHQEVARKIQTEGYITTALGRKRIVFDRRDDDSTLRKMIAYEPQSLVGDILNLGLYHLWRELDLPDDRIQILAQVHDAILFQFWEHDLAAVDEAIEIMQIPVSIRGHKVTIPVEAEVGYAWGHASMAKHRSTRALTLERPAHHTDILSWKVGSGS